MSPLKKHLQDIGRSASDVMTYLAVRLLGGMACAMSLKQARRTACVLGDFVYKVTGLRRDLVHRNLRLTFPEKSTDEIHSIAREVYRSVAITLFDVLRFPLIRSREDAAALIDIDPETFLRGTDHGRKGAVLVSAHYSNWELMAMAFGYMVTPITMIVKELSNKLVDRQMNELRTSKGNSIVYDDQALREGLRLLGRGGVLAILADQSDPSSTYFGKFLGRRATIFNGAAFFALKAQVPLFVGICRRSSDGRYIVDTHEIETSDLTFCKEDIITLASRYTRVLEDYIRRWPEEWFWLHNRWKNGEDKLDGE
jgi:KDO2-lipid IV(A) lauroyltransferase